MACSVVVKSTNANLRKGGAVRRIQKMKRWKVLPFAKSTIFEGTQTDPPYPLFFRLFLALFITGFGIIFTLFLFDITVRIEQFPDGFLSGFKSKISEEKRCSWWLFLCTENFLCCLRKSSTRFRGFRTISCDRCTRYRRPTSEIAA